MILEDDPEDFRPSISGTAWLVTFTDLVSLLLTFFVMLFAMSHVGVGKWERMADSLSQSLNPSREGENVATTARHAITTTFRKRAVNLDYLAVVFEETIGADPFLKRCQVIKLDDRLVIAMPGDLLFDSDSAVLSERARKAVFDVGGVLRNIGNQVAVNGHTDPLAPSGRYTSNWELSVARAVAVANALRRSGYEHGIAAYGYGDGAFSSLPDLSPEQKRALARRVDVVILPDVTEK